MIYFLVFLCVAQFVSLFFFWNTFRGYILRSNVRLRNMEQSFDSKDPVIETLRLVVKKLSEETKEDMKSLGSHTALLDARLGRLENRTSSQKESKTKRLFTSSSQDQEMI